MGGLTESEMSRFDPKIPAERNGDFRSPLDPPGEFPYGSPNAKPGQAFHGAVGQEGVNSEGKPIYQPAEEFSVTPNAKSYTVRVGLGGPYADHVFLTEEEAVSYAKSLAARGTAAIRSDSALPYMWPGGAPGSPVDMARVFEVPPNTPFLRSGVAAQPESFPGAPAGTDFAGGGAQVQLAYGAVTRSSVPILEVAVRSDNP